MTTRIGTSRTAILLALIAGMTLAGAATPSFAQSAGGGSSSGASGGSGSGGGGGVGGGNPALECLGLQCLDFTIAPDLPDNPFCNGPQCDQFADKPKDPVDPWCKGPQCDKLAANPKAPKPQPDAPQALAATPKDCGSSDRLADFCRAY